MERSDLASKMVILDRSTAYKALIERANYFLITSRLDPLPNVGIDALLTGKPTFCFDKACGIANLLRGHDLLGKLLVADYLDIDMMSTQVVHLIENEEIRDELTSEIKTSALKWFNMASYVQKLKDIGEQEVLLEKKNIESVQYLKESKAIHQGFAFTNKEKITTQSINYYLMSWAKNIGARKPMPGFHPGIYRENIISNIKGVDPFVHYLKAGRPDGDWSYPLITVNSEVSTSIESMKVCVHIHVFYPEILVEILEGLQCNLIQPDIFLTYSNQKISKDIQGIVNNFNIACKSIQLVPNRGRDIGPLLCKLGMEIDKNYDVYGHFHTKKVY